MTTRTPRYRRRTSRRTRRGGMYLIVLGTSMIVALLGLAAVMEQRIQNRLLTNSAHIEQARLNAHSAAELALLTMKQNANWRTVQSNGTWFAARATGAGTCSASVADPLDANLADDPTEPLLIRGIGNSGKADQRYEVLVDPRRQPLGCLRSAVAAADIDLQNDTLRATGPITANTVSASSSQVYGAVQAVTISGATYNGTTTQVPAAKLPAMPDWAAAFSYYRTNGTEINVNSLPSWSNINLGRNVGIESAVSSADWTGSAPGVSNADVNQSNNYNHTSGGNYSLRVRNRTVWYAGANQYIDGYVKPGQQYYIEAWVLSSANFKNFRFTLYTKGTSDSGASIATGPDILATWAGAWYKISATLNAPAWNGNLEYAFVKVAGDSNNTSDFYVDDLVIRETTTGKLIYQQVLGPGVNPFGGTTNAQGIYWINCAGNKLVIERARIFGTLLVVNPGAGSCIANGPIVMSPAVAGFPVLLVDADSPENADFGIYATNRALSEKENGVNFNPAGASHGEFGQDADMLDIYQSAITGLVAIRDDLTFANAPLIRGQLIVGDDISNSSGTLDVQYQPESLFNPPPGFWGPYTYVRRPISARKAVLP